MMISKYFYLLLSIPLLVGADPATDPVEELFELSGMNVAIDDFDDQLFARAQASQPNIPKHIQTELRKITDELNLSTVLRNELMVSIKKFSPEEIEKLLRYYRSPAGRFVVKSAESYSKQMTTQEGIQGMIKYLSELQQTPACTPRMELVNRLLTKTRTVDQVLILQRETGRVFFEAWTKDLSDEQMLKKREEFDLAFKQNEPAIRQQLEAGLLNAILYSTKDLSFSDLSAYVDEMSKPEHERLAVITIQSMEASLKKSIPKLASSVKELSARYATTPSIAPTAVTPKAQDYSRGAPQP